MTHLLRLNTSFDNSLKPKFLD